jgi:methionine sulfoxide reductase heme-binding subunit
MDEISAVDVSATVGLIAMVLLTLNILMGLLVSTNYHYAQHWPHRKLPWPLFKVHNWTGYIAMCVAVLHPAILLFANAKTVHFGIGDVLWPLQSKGQTGYNVLGGLTFYSFLLVVTTSYFRPKLGYRPWKKLHYVAYLAAICMYLHGTLIDQNLKGQDLPDFLDAEKVLVEVCCLLVLAGSIWRWRYGSEKKRYQEAKRAGKSA